MNQTTKPLSPAGAFLVSRIKRGDKIPEVVLRRFFENKGANPDDKMVVAEAYEIVGRFNEAGWSYGLLQIPDKVRDCKIKLAEWFEEQYWRSRQRGIDGSGLPLVIALRMYDELGMRERITACAGKLADNGEFFAAAEIFEAECLPQEAQRVRARAIEEIRNRINREQVKKSGVE